eukprot:11223171-Lingulodinium_polyedra.AAC.1
MSFASARRACCVATLTRCAELTRGRWGSLPPVWVRSVALSAGPFGRAASANSGGPRAAMIHRRSRGGSSTDPWSP